jgi:hypothetical protein
MKKLNSSCVYFLFVMAVMGLVCARAAFGQTACTATTPCVPATINNANTLPSPAVLWTCVGSACTQAALTAAQAGQTATNLCPAVQSVWHCLQFSQTKTPQIYNDPEAWGAMVTYSSQGTSGGGVAANSALSTFQVPSAPAKQTSVSILSAIVTSGTAGPQ